MFFIFPLRTEKDTKRYPNFTIALIVINFIIWAFTSKTISNDNKQIINLHQELCYIESQYITSPERSEQLKLRNPLTFHEFIITKKIIPPDSPSYAKWLSLFRDFKKLIENSFLHKWGFIPAHLNFFKLFISLFLHTGFWHAFFNMLFLWIVGCNLEDDWGWPRFLGLYLFSGIVAGLVHALYAGNMTQPCVGASGAVAGVMGAFMVQHFKTKIRFFYLLLIFFYPIYGSFRIFAGIVLPIWFFFESINAFSGIQTGTAHWAHVGGFIFGALIVVIIKYVSGDMERKTALSKEKLKQNKLAEITNLPAEAEYTPAFIAQLNQINTCEPHNYLAKIHLARNAYSKGNYDETGLYYNQALNIIIELRDEKTLLSIYSEIRKYKILKKINPLFLFKIASLLEKTNQYLNAVQLYSAYVKWYPQCQTRASLLYRIFLLAKNKINNPLLARKALNLLKQKYPKYYKEKLI